MSTNVIAVPSMRHILINKKDSLMDMITVYKIEAKEQLKKKVKVVGSDCGVSFIIQL